MGITTSHFKIFDYWKDKCISKYGIVKPMSEFNADDVQVVYDWGENDCWGCGRWATKSSSKIEKLEEDSRKRDEFDFQTYWNSDVTKKALERAHIIPRACGGADEPSNLFLLCPECHALSPDTVNASAFLRWVYERRKNTWRGFSSLPILKEKLKKEIELRCLSFETLCEDVSFPANYDEFKAFRDDYNAYSLKTMTTHASSVSESTLIVNYVNYLVSRFLDKQLE